LFSILETHSDRLPHARINSFFIYRVKFDLSDLALLLLQPSLQRLAPVRREKLVDLAVQALQELVACLDVPRPLADVNRPRRVRDARKLRVFEVRLRHFAYYPFVFHTLKYSTCMYRSPTV